MALAAKAGYAPAQYMLARAYQTGHGCVRSGAISEHWFRAAAEGGHVESQFELGLILLNNRDLFWAAGLSAVWLGHRADQEEPLAAALFPSAGATLKDPQAAFQWLMKAAMAGKPEAQANVGWLLLKGSGCETDRAEAHRWLSLAARHNIGQAALGLAEYHGETGTDEYDPALSAHWAGQASHLGNGSGSWRYGIALRDGLGVAKNIPEAERYLSLAADQGHHTAGYDSAVLMLAREPTPEQLLSAIERLRSCAKRNHVPSALLLADLYGRGDRIRPDLREVAKWYLLVAETGHPQAMFMMGCLYARGDGVVHDLKHAARYFELAAQAGHVQAAFNLGLYRLNGQGIERNISEAKRWLHFAAEAGLCQAQLCLGQILDQEAETSTEADAARLLIKRAADSGSIDAKLSLSRMLIADGSDVSKDQAIVLLTEAMGAGDVDACEILLRMPVVSDLDYIIQMLQRSIHSGNVRAKAVLAEALLTNEHVPRDPTRAIMLLKQGVAEGDAQACFLTGVIYCQGQYISKDLKIGFEFYLQAAKISHPLAQYNTGIMLLQGIGVERNVSEGVAWIRKAAGNNVLQAVRFLGDIEKQASLAETSI
ncbi:tetratricopeptide repeat protein [Methylobacterium haplocladii]|uniref:tetratricopeptide repeat protein n=1 Tax=Methylobacterium haplocladii TaxID=1176176 RepID=UPI00147879AC|nr:SEL1-like repeat protein [Methylobacterium haplocladii]